jgi:hypothetical protein
MKPTTLAQMCFDIRFEIDFLLIDAIEKPFSYFIPVGSNFDFEGPPVVVCWN